MTRTMDSNFGFLQTSYSLDKQIQRSTQGNEEPLLCINCQLGFIFRYGHNVSHPRAYWAQEIQYMYITCPILSATRDRSANSLTVKRPFGKPARGHKHCHAVRSTSGGNTYAYPSSTCSLTKLNILLLTMFRFDQQQLLKIPRHCALYTLDDTRALKLSKSH